MTTQRDIRGYLKSIPKSTRRALRSDVICSTYGPFSVVVCWGLATVVAMFGAAPGVPLIGTSIVSALWVLPGMALGVTVGFALTRWLGNRAVRHFLTHICANGHLPYCPACRYDLRATHTPQCPKCGCPVVIPEGA